MKDACPFFFFPFFFFPAVLGEPRGLSPRHRCAGINPAARDEFTPDAPEPFARISRANHLPVRQAATPTYPARERLGLLR